MSADKAVPDVEMCNAIEESSLGLLCKDRLWLEWLCGASNSGEVVDRFHCSLDELSLTASSTAGLEGLQTKRVLRQQRSLQNASEAKALLACHSPAILTTHSVVHCQPTTESPTRHRFRLPLHVQEHIEVKAVNAQQEEYG